MELALYCVPRALYSVYLKLERAGRLPHIPHFDLALFCASAGVLLHYAEAEPASVRHSIFTFMRWLYGLDGEHPGHGPARPDDAKAIAADADDAKAITASSSSSSS
jgi:hypothetical protein